MSFPVVCVAACLWLAALAVLDHDARRRRVIAARLKPAAACSGEPHSPLPTPHSRPRRRKLLGFAVRCECPQCQHVVYFGPTGNVEAMIGSAVRLPCGCGTPLESRPVVVTRVLVPQLRPLVYSQGDATSVALLPKGTPPC